MNLEILQNNFATLPGLEEKQMESVLTSLLSLVAVGGTSIAMAPPAYGSGGQSGPAGSTTAELRGGAVRYRRGFRQPPRFRLFSPEGDLYVADIATGKIIVLPDRNHDGKPDKVVTVASGLNNPNNVVFRGGAVYVGELGRVLRLVDTNGDLVSDISTVLISGLPADGRHKTKTVGFGPDSKLYLNVGSFSDDASEATNRATIWQFNAEGTGGRVYSKRLRNVVGFDWDPTTGQMWGSDNGADDLGDNVPVDEFNKLVDGATMASPSVSAIASLAPPSRTPSAVAHLRRD